MRAAQAHQAKLLPLEEARAAGRALREAKEGEQPKPPPVKKVKTTKENKMSNPLIDNIRNVQSSPARTITALLWGPTKTGKTHFIGTMPGPVLVLATSFARDSDPTLREMERDDIDIIDIVSVDAPPSEEDSAKGRACMVDVINSLPAILEAKGYRTVAVDTLTTYMKLCVSKQRGEDGARMSYERWDNIATHFQWMLERLHDTGCHIVWTAHEAYTKSEEILIEERADIPGSSLKLIHRTCNLVVKMDTRFKTVEESTPTGNKRKKVRQFVMWLNDPGTLTLPIRVGNHFAARLNKPVMVNPTFQKMASVLAPEDGSKPALIAVASGKEKEEPEKAKKAKK